LYFVDNQFIGKPCIEKIVIFSARTSPPLSLYVIAVVDGEMIFDKNYERFEEFRWFA